MSMTSLNKFSVPTPDNQGMLMPKLKYRFRVFFENFGVSGKTTELTKQVVTAARPQVQFENQTIHVYNSQIKYAGKPTWQSLAISIRDDVGGGVTTLVAEQLQKQFDFWEQASAAGGVDYKFQTRLEMLDGGNGAKEGAQVLESWLISGCYLQTVNYNELAYAESTPMEIALTIEFDNAVQVGPGDNPYGQIAGAYLAGRQQGTGGTLFNAQA